MKLRAACIVTFKLPVMDNLYRRKASSTLGGIVHLHSFITSSCHRGCPASCAPPHRAVQRCCFCLYRLPCPHSPHRSPRHLRRPLLHHPRPRLRSHPQTRSYLSPSTAHLPCTWPPCTCSPHSRTLRTSVCMVSKSRTIRATPQYLRCGQRQVGASLDHVVDGPQQLLPVTTVSYYALYLILPRARRP